MQGGTLRVCTMGGEPMCCPQGETLLEVEGSKRLHIAQQMLLPLTISCSSKSRLVLTCLVLPFWYLLTRVVLDIFQKSSETVVCVCVCLCVCVCVCVCNLFTLLQYVNICSCSMRRSSKRWTICTKTLKHRKLLAMCMCFDLAK